MRALLLLPLLIPGLVLTGCTGSNHGAASTRSSHGIASPSAGRKKAARTSEATIARPTDACILPLQQVVQLSGVSQLTTAKDLAPTEPGSCEYYNATVGGVPAVFLKFVSYSSVAEATGVFASQDRAPGFYHDWLNVPGVGDEASLATVRTPQQVHFRKRNLRVIVAVGEGDVLPGGNGPPLISIAKAVAAKLG